MNKLTMIGLISFLTIMCGCAPKTSDLIVGKWETSSEHKIQAEFREDGTCSFILKYKGFDVLVGPELQEGTVLIDAEGEKKLEDLAGQIEIPGTWEMHDNSRITITVNDPPNTPPSTSTISIKGDVMEMIGTNNTEIAVYSRIK